MATQNLVFVEETGASTKMMRPYSQWPRGNASSPWGVWLAA
jgi:hypothetical protein